MMRRLLILLLFLILCAPAQAKPNWKRVIKIAVVWGAPVATSLLATKGGVDCRHRNGVEFCSEKYGAFYGFEGARAGFSFSMSALTWKCLKDVDSKGCYTFAVGTSAYNVGWFLHEEKVTAPSKIGHAILFTK